MGIIEEIDRVINMHMNAYGEDPRIIVLSAQAWGEANYQVGKQEGLSDSDALFNNLTKYKGYDVAVSHGKLYPNVKVY